MTNLTCKIHFHANFPLLSGGWQMSVISVEEGFTFYDIDINPHVTHIVDV